VSVERFLCFVMFIPHMTKTAKALQLAHNSGVIMVSMPGHTTHRVQPMDVAFFRPLRSCYTEEIENWLRGNPGRYVAQAKVAVIFWLRVRKSSYCGHGNQRLQVYRDMASKQICISRPSFLSFCGEYFRRCLCTASSGRVTRRCGSKSSLSQRTRNGNTYLLVPVEKISPLSKAHTACSTQKNRTGPKCLRRRQNELSLLRHPARLVTKKSNR